MAAALNASCVTEELLANRLEDAVSKILIKLVKQAQFEHWTCRKEILDHLSSSSRLRFNRTYLIENFAVL